MRNPIYRQIPMRKRLRCGVQTLELIIAFPLLLIASMAILQFATISAFQATVEAAVAEAAREAAKAVDPLDAPQTALDTFNRAMQMHGITTGVTPQIALAVEQVGSQSIFGDQTVTPISLPSPGGVAVGEVRVTAWVALRSAPTPNLLKSFGLNFQHRYIETSHVSGA
ncbi:MAG: hypothetical protein ACIALR_13600 [Blastopirellula sp. JB062]